MADDPPMLFLPIGKNPARLFGLDARERALRLAANAGFETAGPPATGRATLVASMAYAWDPFWLRAVRGRPRTVLTLGGKAVMAHVPAGEQATDVAAALENGVAPAGYDAVESETAELNNMQLRKRERPFVLALDPASPELVERAAYDGADNGVTDFLTLYLWRRPAFFLTRWAAQAGLTPNMVTAVGALLCVLAFFLFWNGHYWMGVLSAFIVMVLDTVDGKLAQCTGASSKWGNMLDHGIEVVHPPAWWWAWEHGLTACGRPLEPVSATMVLWAIIGGYVAQRVVEGLSIKRFGGMEIHLWRPIDSKFRLITAGRNPNMAILVGALLVGRPDSGLVLVAWWTIASLIFHAVRMAQGNELVARGGTISSWLNG